MLFALIESLTVEYTDVLEMVVRRSGVRKKDDMWCDRLETHDDIRPWKSSDKYETYHDIRIVVVDNRHSIAAVDNHSGVVVVDNRHGIAAADISAVDNHRSRDQKYDLDDDNQCLPER